jgi:GNAT superfamily N-acetyltransferase
MELRRLTPDDIPELHALEAESYLPSLHESDEAFLRLIELYPEGALGYFDADGMCAYAFGVPLRAGSWLELRRPLPEIPPDADTFYIHDVVVAARHRRRGLGSVVAAKLLELARARGFKRSELVSVQGSAPFWERAGFRTVAEFEYATGAPSARMVRDLSA